MSLSDQCRLIKLKLFKEDVRIIGEKAKTVDTYVQVGQILTVAPEKTHPDQYSDIFFNGMGSLLVDEPYDDLAARINSFYEEEKEAEYVN